MKMKIFADVFVSHVYLTEDAERQSPRKKSSRVQTAYEKAVWLHHLP